MTLTKVVDKNPKNAHIVKKNKRQNWQLTTATREWKQSSNIDIFIFTNHLFHWAVWMRTTTVYSFASHVNQKRSVNIAGVVKVKE